MKFLNKKSNKLFLILLFSLCLFDLQAMHTLKRAQDVIFVLQKRFIDFEENLEKEYFDSSGLNLTDDEFSQVIMQEIKDRGIQDRIKILNLSKNSFTELPDLSCLENLENLILSGNKIRKIKKSRNPHLTLSNNRQADLDVELRDFSNEGLVVKNIKLLKKLKGLDLSGDLISWLPKEIGLLKNLIKLDLSNNELSTLPDELWNITGLEILDLSGNYFDLLPEKISRLKGLKKLKISKQQISSTIQIPESLKERIDSEELIVRGEYDFYDSIDEEVDGEKKDERSWARYSLDVINYYLGRK